MRVLIVEDDSATARQIEIVLSKEGFIPHFPDDR